MQSEEYRKGFVAGQMQWARRLHELRENAGPQGPLDWDDVEILRLMGAEQKHGGSSAAWFAQMAEKLAETLRMLDNRGLLLAKLEERQKEREAMNLSEPTDYQCGRTDELKDCVRLAKDFIGE